ncbi:hypothetical protein KP509_01G000700 [Ceratopteris richardii]|uniref:Uncharacterized protein n=1 Tax=Ceratopteris richardii TaxID=49495 RepID=A0A8T2VA00_CERRI|nr:hypothetical protein KP509_01G000700 [Ceratopteris richardii]
MTLGHLRSCRLSFCRSQEHRHLLGPGRRPERSSIACGIVLVNLFTHRQRLVLVANRKPVNKRFLKKPSPPKGEKKAKEVLRSANFVGD